MTEEAASILVVDDEQSITDFVSYSLMKEGFKVDVANNGEDALEQATRKHYDLFVLDIMLPGMDGYELCRRLRSRTTAPVLFLSARDTELDKVVGLEIGGDDYLAKPFGVRELIARVRALLRRGTLEAPDSGALVAAGITLDEDRHTADSTRVRAACRPYERRRQGRNPRRFAARSLGLGIHHRNENGRHAHQTPARQNLASRLRPEHHRDRARLRLPPESIGAVYDE